MHPKIFDLHDALGLRIVDLGLEVYAIDQVIVKDPNLCQTSWHLEFCEKVRRAQKSVACAEVRFSGKSASTDQPQKHGACMVEIYG